MEPSEFKIKLSCALCQKTTYHKVPKTDWDRYVEGVIASKAFTTLTEDQKQEIGTGMCRNCWDQYIAEPI